MPEIQLNLFSPFIQNFISNPTLDPWTNWVNNSGRLDSFPYGIVMLLYFSIFAIPFNVISDSILSVQLSIATGLAFVEVAVWFLAVKLFPSKSKFWLPMLAFSPILIISTYFHGQLDLFPAAILFIGMLFLRNSGWALAGLLIGIAISIKFSFALVLPIFFTFFLKNRQYQRGAWKFTIYLIPGVIFFAMPLVSTGYRKMVVETPQTAALLKYSLDIGFKLYLAPIAIAFFILIIWRLRSSNLDILFAVTTFMLSVIPLMMPSSPGWFLWGLLPLIFLTIEFPFRYKLLVFILGFLESALALFSSSGSVSRTSDLNFSSEWVPASFIGDLPEWIPNSLKSMSLLAGIFVFWRLYEVSIKFFDVYKLSNSPLSVLIAGDSGSGKDTLCNSLGSAFNHERCSFIFGDDYHLFERQSANWDAKTHLNPITTDISSFSRDSLELLKGNEVWSHHYDHSVGKFTKLRKITSGDLVVISGLHALTLAQLRESTDLSVFLDMDNELRKYLKIQRDVNERMKDAVEVLKSINEREIDREKYIQTQLDFADLIIKIIPESKVDLKSLSTIPRLKIVLILRDLNFGLEFSRRIVSLTECETSFEYLDEPSLTKITLRDADNLTIKDISAVANKEIDRQNEIFVSEPEWKSGVEGILQLLVIIALLEKRKQL